MRAVILAVLILSLFPIDKVLGDCICADPDPSMTRQPQPIGQNRDSSFRGIGLSSPPEHVRWYAQTLGFETVTRYVVGSDIVSTVSICANGAEVGRADYDEAGRMLRLALKQRFFTDKHIFVRRFADDLFELYDVHATAAEDDACFQDVTCFRGVSRYGEQFLIMRFGTEAELNVRP